jgi:N,N'-diacetylchitobiose transport system permease protein
VSLIATDHTDLAAHGGGDLPALPPDPPSPARRRRRWGSATPYLLALPAVALLIALLAIPLVRMVIVSMQKYERPQLWGFQPAKWVGLGNYTKLFSDPQFWAVVEHTVIFTVVAVSVSVLIGLATALLMRRVSRWVRIAMSVAMMLTWAMPQLVAAQVFVWMVDADFGVVNWLIDQIPGVDFSKHSWFADTKQGWVVITALVVWGAIPFLAITLYAGLSQVPKELTEAATVDGANAWHVFRAVSLPILRPLIVIVTTLSVIWDFQVFTQVWVLRYGKPEFEYQTLSTYAFSEAFGSGKYGLGAAASIVTVVLMLGVMVFYLRQMFKIGDSD